MNKNYKLKYLLFAIIAIVIVLIIIYLLSTQAYAPSNNNNNEILTNTSNTISNLPTEELSSSYVTKHFKDLPHLLVENLTLNYENNITTIKFNLHNSSENEQEPFNFTFSLLDDTNSTIINFDLSLKENLKSNTTKEFVLIATRDVSLASDYQISIIN